MRDKPFKHRMCPNCKTYMKITLSKVYKCQNCNAELVRKK